MASSLGFSMIQDIKQLKPLYDNNKDSQNENKITANMIQSFQKDMINPTRMNNNDDDENSFHVSDNQKQNEPQDKTKDQYQNVYENPSEYDLNSKYNQQYETGIGSYNTITKNDFFDKSQSDELLTKLNYMIHMLEEQQDTKSDHVMEEIILYCFLGVFIIYTIDSFTKVGKYTR